MHAFVWRQGEMQDIGSSPDYSGTSAMAISDRGEIVGEGLRAKNGRPQAVRFADGAVISLEDEVRNRGDWLLFSANSVNNDGVIVGRGMRRGDGQQHGFVLRVLP